jgi:hypothetical protein
MLEDYLYNLIITYNKKLMIPRLLKIHGSLRKFKEKKKKCKKL